MKNIVFCADGTWNGSDRDEDGDGVPDVTNVARLFSLLDGTTTPETLRLHDEQEKQLLVSGDGGDGVDASAAAGVGQVAKYLHGVGDSRNPIEKILGGVFGSGLVARIVRGYTFISRHYEDGDRIVITGFSRGAYTARALAGLIASMGLLAPIPGDDRELAYRKGIGAWAAYRRKAGRADSILDAFDGFRAASVSADDFVAPVTIAAVGVWDTVGAYGVPIYDPRNMSRLDLFKFADTALSSRVKQGFHAVSIDEQRLDFVPTLWDARDGVEQVWFAGAHADVGGGYPKPILALYSLDWMVDRLKTTGLLFTGNAFDLPTEFEPIHTPWTELPFKGFPHELREHPPTARFHESVQNMLDRMADYVPESLTGFLTDRRFDPDRLVR